MPNEMTSTGIVPKSYNSRGLITHRANTRALTRQSNGILWAAVREGTVDQYINIYFSIDNGFSWSRMFADNLTSSGTHKTGIAGLNANGPRMHLNVFDWANRLILWHSYLDLGSAKYNVEVFAFPLTMDVRYATTDSPSHNVPAANVIVLDMDELAFTADYNHNSIYLTYVSFSDLKVQVYKPTYQVTAAATGTYSLGHFFNVFDAIAHKDGYQDIAILTTELGTYRLKHTRFTEKSASFSTLVEITNTLGTPEMCDVAIARDGFDTLCVTWGQGNTAGTDMDAYYSISTDEGVTWTAASQITKTLGHSVFTDSPTAQKSTRSTIAGGLNGGFLISYVNCNGDGTARTYVRSVTTSDDGVTYQLGSEQEIATLVAEDTDEVVGLRFFHPPASKLMDLTDPGLVRAAYQIGQGNSTVQTDTKPVRFGQELLKLSAYPSELGTESDEYVVDGDIPSGIVVTFSIIGAPNENEDYYAAGYTGRVTDRILAAFQKAGTDMRVLRYEPLVDSEMNDRSAYGEPTENSVRMVLESQSYESAVGGDRGVEPFRTFVERDIRKAFIPPNFHLARTYITNKGNYHKRTVWTVAFDGNEYELSQVVPYTVSDQISHYTSNAYVVGPSNDPWSKNILPSET